jgi:hypothetical protein
LFANVILPALLFMPPAVLAVIVCEVTVYWLLFRRNHRFPRIVLVVLLANLASTLFGWIVYPPATGIPPPNPMAGIAIHDNEPADERSAARTAITEQFAIGYALSVLIEGLAVLPFLTEFGWRRLSVAVVASNALSYAVLCVGFLAATGRLR